MPRRVCWAPVVALILFMTAPAGAQSEQVSQQAGQAAAQNERGSPAVQWRERARMPHAVFMAAGSQTDTHLIITGGLGALATPTRHIQVYEPASNQWAAPLRLKNARFGHAQATLPDGRVLVIGGKTPSDGGKGHARTDSVELIDLAANTVAPVAALPKAIGDPQAVVLPDGRVVVTGQRAATVYDPAANAWSPPIQLRLRRASHAALALDGRRVLLVGGNPRSQLEIVDLSAGVSRALAAKLPHGLDDLAITTRADGTPWVLGGQRYDTGDTLAQTWLLRTDEAADTSALEPAAELDIPGGLADHRVVTLGPWAVVTGGETQQAGQDTERKTVRLLDRRTGQVYSLPATTWPHDDALAFTRGRSVYVVGGFGTIGLAQLPAALPYVEQLTLPDRAFE